MAKALTLKNHQLIPLANWLVKLQLHGKESRARTRFGKILSDRVAEQEKERVALCEKYSAKNKKGEIIYLDKEGKDTTEKKAMNSYKITDTDKFNEEYADYMKEDFVVDVTPATSETVYGVRDIILNTKEEFSGVNAIYYDEWCTAFEAIA